MPMIRSGRGPAFWLGLVAFGMTVAVAPWGLAAEDPPISVPEGVTNSVGMKLKLIPAGSFLRGSTDADPDADANERPRRRITIRKAFRIGVYEVTQKQYKAVMGTNPSKFSSTDDRPVETVNWLAAVEFCNKLSLKERRRPCYRIEEERVTILPDSNGYRLPTEAEWEYACRGGSASTWGVGPDASRLGDYAWYDANAGYGTQPVGKKRPNGFGLYDMQGNVFEWCQDYYAADAYQTAPDVDPTGPNLDPKGPVSRVFRGGSWTRNASYCRPAYRDNFDPRMQTSNLGFRVVIVPTD